MFALSNPLDPGAVAGLGIGFMIIALVLYLGLIALMIWISYLIMRTAVKNGVILAMRESGAQFAPQAYRPQTQGQAPGQAPTAWPPTSGS